VKIRRRKIEVGIPYLPMADIAFNLVLFFIMLAKTQDDSNLQWTPAHASRLENIREATVTVTVDRDQKVYFNGTQVGNDQLTGEVSQALGNRPAGKRAVLLKIHDQAAAATFEPIIEAVSQAGGEVFHVLEEEKKAGN
jgi:biopolymer transport protein ExbD